MHYQHKFKHLGCGLHFIVTSYYEEWATDGGRQVHKMWCPECGGTEGFIHWVERSEDEIFTVVPGKAELVSIAVS